MMIITFGLLALTLLGSGADATFGLTTTSNTYKVRASNESNYFTSFSCIICQVDTNGGLVFEVNRSHSLIPRC